MVRCGRRFWRCRGCSVARHFAQIGKGLLYTLMIPEVRSGPKKSDSIVVGNLLRNIGRELGEPLPVKFDNVLLTRPT
jgi:hypothetical protein